MSKTEYSDLINLKGLIEAIKYIDKLLESNEQDIVFDNIPPLTTQKLRINQLFQDAQNPQNAKADLTNVILVNKMIEELGSYKNNYTFNPSQIFGPPVNVEIAPKYYDVIHKPMCLFYIRLRLQINIQKSIEIENDGFGENLLHMPAEYGSINQYRQSLYHVQNTAECARRKLRELEKEEDFEIPEPYSKLSQILNDLLVIACNCCIYNAISDEMKQQGIMFQNQIIQLAEIKFGLITPDWAKKCTEPYELSQYNINVKEGLLD